MGESTATSGGTAWFVVLYARPSTRKHKKWELDGFIECPSNGECLLWDDGKRNVVSRSTLTPAEIANIRDGDEFGFGAYEVQIQEAMAAPRPPVPVIKPATPQLQPLATRNPAKRPLDDGLDLNAPPVKATRGFVSPFASVQAKANNWHLDENEKSAYIEGRIANKLREHQRDGILFMYERLTKCPGGAILADDMGLGKSIQTISTCLALLKNNSLSISKVLIVVPSSLVANWLAEFRKWFPYGKFPAIAVKSPADFSTYSSSCTAYPFLICSYDMVLRHHGRLAPLNFDVLVCDEAHRLKNPDAKLRTALESIGAERRLLLTGTPLQNELCELYSLLDFTQPGRLGTSAEFAALVKEDRCSELLSDIMIRRGSEVNAKALPPKTEYILYCRPSQLQVKLMQELCDDMMADPLTIIMHLRSIANHPSLFLGKNLEEGTRPRIQRLAQQYASKTSGFVENSGKLVVFASLLVAFAQSGEKAVIFSNFTQTLDMLASFCRNFNFNVERLDGQVPTKERQKIVNRFNDPATPANTILLVSTKAGGTGLNLIGASRLVLFDSDWNPANDLQAMARIWRDGQKKSCHIYRLVTSGTIDEKILQRQIKKTGLHAIFDMETSVVAPEFQEEDLKDIFEVETADESNTHRIMGCHCEGDGTTAEERDIEEEGDGDAESNEKENKMSMSELSSWRHYSSTSEVFPIFLQRAGLDPEAPPASLAFGMLFTSSF